MFKTLILLASFLIVSKSYATEIKVYWPFSAVSDAGLMAKELVDSANAIQKKYKFNFVHKPGAGGSLAVSSVQSEKSLAVLIHSSSFYVRPNLVKDSHNVENFTMINTLCVNQPLGIVSRKFQTIRDFENTTIRIGLIPGSITSLLPRTLSVNYPKINMIEVPYKGTPEATNDMLGGHIEASVDFIGEATTSRLPADAKILGITGTVSHNGLKTFKEQGISGLDNITNSYFIFVKNNIETALSREISEIFYRSLTESVKKLCEVSNGTLSITPFDDLNMVNSDNIIQWRRDTRQFHK